MSQNDNDKVVIEPSVEELIEEFKYRIKPTDTHYKILKCIEVYYKNNEQFMKKGVMAAGDRARQPLVELWKLLRVRRKEIKAQINAKKKHYKEINAKYSKNNYLKKDKPNVP